MKLKQSDKAKEIEIFEPYWATREISIATYKVQDHNIIYFTKANAKSAFPDRYYLSGKTIRKYPVIDMKTKAGTIRVYRVSLDELVVYEGINE